MEGTPWRLLLYIPSVGRSNCIKVKTLERAVYLTLIAVKSEI